MCNDLEAFPVPFVKTTARSLRRLANALGQRGIHLRERLTYPRALATHVVRPGREEEAVGLILDPLPEALAVGGRPERVARDTALAAEALQRGEEVRRRLMRQLDEETALVFRLAAPDAREHLQVGAGDPRRAPRAHVAIVAHLPEPEDRGVKLGERARRGLAIAVREGPRRVDPPRGLRCARRGREGSVEEPRQTRQLVRRQGRERRVMLARGIVLATRED